MRHELGVALALMAALTAASCAEPGDGATVGRTGALRDTTGATEADVVLAELDGERLTMTDVNARVKEELDQIDNAYHKQRHDVIGKALNDLIRNQVFTKEARARGININELIAAEGGSLEVSEQDIQSWYEQNRARLGDRSFEELKGQITDMLRGRRREEVLAELQTRLSEKYGVAYHFDAFRVRLDNEGAPSRGPDNARVTLVEFSDFECPFCGRFFPTLKRIEETYGERIRIVYRQFPITNLHPNAFRAAEASLCAHEQGRFWELHDLMFSEQESLQVIDLKEKAARLGLDQIAFDQCLDSHRHAQRIEADLSAGRSVGVTGTPAIFINGIPVEGGAVGFEVLAKAIEEELKRAER
jgi:protein-disulfide isomerase/predicted transcriptional regulator